MKKTLALAALITLVPAMPTDANTDTASMLRRQIKIERQQHSKDRARLQERIKRLLRHIQGIQERKESGIGYVSPRQSTWLCIHSHEGAWNDPNPPYFGGLQMDWGFMRTYGREFLARYGTADNWPMSVQIMVADRAYEGYGRYGPRGYGPWPQTRRMCGV